MTRVRRCPAAAAPLILSIALALAACGGGSTSSTGTGPSGLHLSAREADCNDWNEASARERLAIVRGITGFEGGPVAGEHGGHGAVLTNGQAYRLFRNNCRNEFARRFKLYKLYARAAPFANFEAGGSGK